MHRTAPTLEQKQAAMEAAARYSLRDFCILACGFGLGLRGHELRQLTIGHVCSGGEQINVRKVLRLERRAFKGGRGNRCRSVASRELPINNEVCDALHRYLSERMRAAPLNLRAPLFLSREGGAISRWQLTRVVHRAMEAAGLGEEGAWGSHSLRRTFAMGVYLRSGRCLLTTQRALGHRFVNTTQDYLDVSGEQVANVVMQLGSTGLESADRRRATV